MRSRIRSDLACIAVALVATSGCYTFDSARIAREWGPGPVVPDPDRSITVSEPLDDQLPFDFPLTVSDASEGWVANCSVRAAWVNAVQRDSILEVPEARLPAVIDTIALGPVDVPGPAEFEFGPPVRMERRSPRIETPTFSADTEMNSVGDLDAALLLELWLGPDPNPRCVPDPGQLPTNHFLIDFTTQRPIGATVWSVGALFVAVIAVSGVVALGG